MNTPIADFVKTYQENKITRFHMPGHKGHVFFGCEPFDITEIKGADVLHHGDGIIAESEKNATLLFGCGATHYSTEGSTHCIKSMLGILMMESKQRNQQKRPFILAARNVHRSMIDACALLDLDVSFLWENSNSICDAVVTKEYLERTLNACEQLPLAVYITSPDYLGHVADIQGLSGVCQKYDVPLVVDNAHGAYLHFEKEPKHPMDLGAAMCCDSAHKTLPVLTGGAYLHISKVYLKRFEPYAVQVLSLFGSTSPSYPVLQSLDLCNRYLSDNYQIRLQETQEKIAVCKEEFIKDGIIVEESESLKIVINTAANGYTGDAIAEEMRKSQIECEYSDWQNVVLMITPENEDRDFERLTKWKETTCLITNRQQPLAQKPVCYGKMTQKMTIREAVFSAWEWIEAKDAVGRICAMETVSCPPAIPIAVSGEEITTEMVQLFDAYGISKIAVVRTLPL